MPRAEAPDDPTRLTASRMDIPVRIGWVLRTHREVGGLSLRQMSAELREHGVALSAPTLSRIESEGQRSAAALDGYARVLGLPEGSLRSLVDMLCRSFSYAPGEVEPTEPASLERFSATYEAVTGLGPRGVDWSSFARQHAGTGFGLPTGLMRPAVRRLADELERSVGPALPARHGALSRLLHGPYGDVVQAELREQIESADRPRVYMIADILSERAAPGVVAWFGALLSHAAVDHARAASFGLQSLLVAGGSPLADWDPLVPALLAAWPDEGTDDERRAALLPLVRAMPPVLQDRFRLHRDLPVEVHDEPWTRDRRNARYEYALDVAREACRRRGHREEPLLGRLVFEGVFETRGVRMANARMLLGCSPFADDLAQVLHERVAEAPGVPRLQVLSALNGSHRPRPMPGGPELLGSLEPAEAAFAVSAAGRAGQLLPENVLRRELAHPPRSPAALYAAGMAADPRLRDVADDPAYPQRLRRHAAWWAARGGRVLD